MVNAVILASEGFGVSDIISNVTQIMSLGTSTLSTLLSEPIMGLIFSVGFVGLGFSVIRKMKRTARA